MGEPIKENPPVIIHCHEYNALLDCWEAAISLISVIQDNGCVDDKLKDIIARIEKAHIHYCDARILEERRFGPKFDRPRHNEKK